MAEQEGGARNGRGCGRGRRQSTSHRDGSISPRRGVTYVVKKTVRDIGGTQFPILTSSNYAEWEVIVKMMLKACRLWKAVSIGTEDEKDDQLAMEAILKAVPSEYHVARGSKDTAKDTWDALKTMRLGNEHAQKAKAQQLHREYEALKFHDDEAIEDFALRVTGLVTQLGALGEPVSEEATVRKFLRTALERFDQLGMSIETCLEMEALTIEDVTERLKAVEERLAARATRVAAAASSSNKLYLTQEEWEARAQKMAAWAGSSAPPRGGDGGGGGGKKQNVTTSA